MLSIKEFHEDISQVIHLLEEDREEEAKELFNTDIRPNYVDYIDKAVAEKEPLLLLVPFFYEVSEYFNTTARYSGLVTKEYLIGSFYSDYGEDLEKALQKERNQAAKADFALVSEALHNPKKKAILRAQVADLVEGIAARYADLDTSRSGPAGWVECCKRWLLQSFGRPVADKAKLITVGWRDFDVALENYHRAMKKRIDEGGELFRFSPYLSWYVRRSIREHIGIKNPGV